MSVGRDWNLFPAVVSRSAHDCYYLSGFRLEPMISVPQMLNCSLCVCVRWQWVLMKALVQVRSRALCSRLINEKKELRSFSEAAAACAASGDE